MNKWLFLCMCYGYALMVVGLLITGHPGGAISLWLASVVLTGVLMYRVHRKLSRRLVDDSIDVHKPLPRPHCNSRF